MVLGNVSNIIVCDGGICGFVILCDKFNYVFVDGYIIEVEVGVNLIEIICIVFCYSLIGFEFVCGIFGSVGGVVFMNVGVYGGEIVYILQFCKILIKDGEIEILFVKDLVFGYCYLVIQEFGVVVLLVKFVLVLGSYLVIK